MFSWQNTTGPIMLSTSVLDLSARCPTYGLAISRMIRLRHLPRPSKLCKRPIQPRSVVRSLATILKSPLAGGGRLENWTKGPSFSTVMQSAVGYSPALVTYDAGTAIQVSTNTTRSFGAYLCVATSPGQQPVSCRKARLFAQVLG